VPVDAGTGEQTEVIDTAAGLADDHELFVGSLTVDLREAPTVTGRPARVSAAVGVGRLRVIVPDGARVNVEADVGVGEVVSDGGPEANESGVDLEESFTVAGDPGRPAFDLDLEAGIGAVEVTDAP
jgi:hypothetical protein